MALNIALCSSNSPLPPNPLLHLFPPLKPLSPLPTCPRGLLIFGALPQLGNNGHVALGNMAKKYGPVMYVKMGTCSMVVASTPDAARAFLTTLDLNFSNRPPNVGATHLAYNCGDMVFANYGPRWKLLRKLSDLHMLGRKVVEDWSHPSHQARAYAWDYVRYELPWKTGGGAEHAVLLNIEHYWASVIVLASAFHFFVFSAFRFSDSKSNEFKDMVELMSTTGYFNIGGIYTFDSVDGLARDQAWDEVVT
ncbi:flavonoid 3',5'-hydroxylase-like [Cornus florida]|uniref:flavonoid 3',5'-hydroxylase-like n=1 Tax=Cornus florida TaxID=4283 RepID=UPI0028A26D28|nr:flavonoid 3',5'-hydroxylase-like [Cornus florida]